MKQPLSARSRRTSGFTLIEIMVVIAILGMLATIVAVAAGDNAETARKQTAQTQCRLIASAVELFLAEKGRLPELAELTEPDENDRIYLKQLPLDPWQNAYELRPGDPAKRFLVVSYGQDREADTEDDITAR